jgi:hypothetical protein
MFGSISNSLMTLLSDVLLEHLLKQCFLIKEPIFERKVKIFLTIFALYFNAIRIAEATIAHFQEMLKFY